jgi:hypothetical protein
VYLKSAGTGNENEASEGRPNDGPIWEDASFIPDGVI